MDNTMSKLGQIRVFSKVLSKVSQIRNRGAKQKVLNALEKNEYFQRFIHDPVERQQFLSTASPYIKYRFYPKGTAIVEFKKPVSHFSVMVKGKALLYTPKDFDEIKKEGSNQQKSQVIQIYLRYMAREHLEEKFKKWLSNNEHGTKALRKRMASLSFADEVIEKESEVPDEDDFCAIVEQVLQSENPLLPPHLRENDLSFEDKLLLLSTLGLQGDHLRNGNLALKGTQQLKAGDTFGEGGLIKPVHANYVIMATEDTHIVSFTRLDYKLLFASDIQNIKEKIEFLQKTFTEIPKQTIMEMTYYLEERVLFTSEMAYREGEEADAIYFIKNGEIEISTVNEPRANEAPSLIGHFQSKSKSKFNEKNKLTLGRLPAGSIFGEEEIIKKMKKRKHSAKALQPLTFLYVIKKNIFNEIFEHYFSDTVHILKDWMDLKYKWREQRIKKEQKIANLRSEENEVVFDKTVSKKKKKVNKNEDSALKARRTVTEKDAEPQTYEEDNSPVLMNATLRFNNLTPNGMGSKLYFGKLKRNPTIKLSPRDSQPQIIYKTNDPKEAVMTKEEIEKQKTKLFVDNQTKFNKFRRPHLTPTGSSSKQFFTNRRPETSSKTELPSTQILNFDKVKDLQKSEKLTTQEATQPSSSRKASTHTVASSRFFIVRSYGALNTSPSSMELDPFWRRHSSHLLREYESPGILSMKNLEVRRGTYANDIKESKFEDEKYEHMKNYMNGLLAQQKTNTNFVIRPATSLQNFERPNRSKPTQIQIPSNAGSLAYLDTKLDEPSLHEPQSAKSATMLIKDGNFAKKVLSPRTIDQVKTSPKIGSINCKLKVNGKTVDKHI